MKKPMNALIDMYALIKGYLVAYGDSGNYSKEMDENFRIVRDFIRGKENENER